MFLKLTIIKSRLQFLLHYCNEFSSIYILPASDYIRLIKSHNESIDMYNLKLMLCTGISYIFVRFCNSPLDFHAQALPSSDKFFPLPFFPFSVFFAGKFLIEFAERGVFLVRRTFLLLFRVSRTYHVVCNFIWLASLQVARQALLQGEGKQLILKYFKIFYL